MNMVFQMIGFANQKNLAPQFIVRLHSNNEI
jgi:hypothetical protein